MSGIAHEPNKALNCIYNCEKSDANIIWLGSQLVPHEVLITRM